MLMLALAMAREDEPVNVLALTAPIRLLISVLHFAHYIYLHNLFVQKRTSHLICYICTQLERAYSTLFNIFFTAQDCRLFIYFAQFFTCILLPLALY